MKEYCARRRDSLSDQRKQYRTENLERINATEKAWRDANKPRIRIKNLNYRTEKADEVKVKQKQWYDAGGAVKKSQTSAIRHKKIKEEFVAAYGGKCARCPETDLLRLCGDHVNDDGHQHLRPCGNRLGSTGLYMWAKRNGWPDTLQCLCHNCNSIKAGAGKNTSHPSIRKEVIGHYSGGTYKCALCPHTTALQIDHIHGGGRKHIASLGGKGGPALMYDLKSQGLPEGYRVLCASCNMEQAILSRKSVALCAV